MTPLENLVGLRSLNGMVLAFAEEEALNTFFQDMFITRGRQARPEGHIFEWEEEQLHRHLAPVVGRDSLFPILEHTTVINRKNALAHIKLSKRIPAGKLFFERAPGSLRPDAKAIVATQVRDLMKVIRNSIEYLSVGTLFGQVVVNPTVIPGSEVIFTLSYSPNTYTAGQTWATASTNHLKEITDLKNDITQTAGLIGRVAIAGSTIQGYLRDSEQIQNLLKQQMGVDIARNGTAQFGRMFDGFELGGLQWHVNESVYVPQGGSATRFVPATDKMVVLPDESQWSDILGLALGRGLVPGGNGIASTTNADELVALAPEPGWYAYAARVMVQGAMFIEIYVGWCGLPFLVFPQGVCVADVVP